MHSEILPRCWGIPNNKLEDWICFSAEFNRRGDAFEDRIEDIEDQLNAEEKEALNLFRGKSLKFIEDMLRSSRVETDSEKRMFKRAFGLFIQKSFLCPASSANISPKHLPVIRDIENTQTRNWTHHVNTFLVEGRTEFKEKERKTAMFRRYNANYIDPAIQRPYLIHSLVIGGCTFWMSKGGGSLCWIPKIQYHPAQEEQRCINCQNLLRDEAIKAAEEIVIHKSSATLQSPYVQVSMGDLKTT
ncbi:hypothetical protein PIB30_042895 [Stylosanthes scabra]|uniref:Uncharacterized protein n=1 Tax=Stylosanthes scabra TaxID=79078 RepID=A0ABU6SFS2_9FABA|nr:hypothetical protein [Stylosanthes scabra]